MTDERRRARVLFVDDDEDVLRGLARLARGYADVEVCSSPILAVRLLEKAGDGEEAFAVVMSDMRMPQMDGAELLGRACVICPETTRLLLTGYADLESAIAAVNEGNVFRFLVKPCGAAQLHSTLKMAIEQNRLVRDRRELLEQTLRGAVEALVETLAMAHPAAFARASRLRQLARTVADSLQVDELWQVEVAAQLAELGVITLPPEALDALIRGTPTDKTITKMIGSLPSVADEVLSRIPRLESVRRIVLAQEPVDRPEPSRLAQGTRAAQILQAVREYDALVARDHSPSSAVGVLRQRPYHDSEILDALHLAVAASGDAPVREADVSELRPGLVLAADLRSSKGMLLVSRGQMITDQLLARIRNFAALSGLESRPLIRCEAE